MTQSKWFENLIEMMDDWEEEGEEFDSFLYPSITQVHPKRESNSEIADDDIEPDVHIPDVLPILPLRGVVVYPHTGVPLTIGQERSIRLVDDAVAGNRLVGLVASVDPELEIPKPKDLYQIGTVATIHRMFRAPDNTIRLLV
ncbi:MAG: LON peptidase substrate-binding domain-containing protein, partial [Chloroflexota bacterium]